MSATEQKADNEPRDAHVISKCDAANTEQAPPITRVSDHRAGHRLELHDWLDKGRVIDALGDKEAAR